VRVRAEIRTLRLRTPMHISRSTAAEVQVVDVEINHKGVYGRGEGTPSRRFGMSAQAACALAESYADELGSDPFALEEITASLDRHTEQTAVRAALDAALHDLRGQILGVPVWKLLGLRQTGPPTSWTIGISDPDDVARQAERMIGKFSRLKVKLGASDGLDVHRIQALRHVTDVPVRVDINEAWTLDEAVDALPQLASLDVELCEQPLKAGDVNGPTLKRLSPIPIYLDEECRTVADVAASAIRGHGINVKLEECGGIREATRMVHAARRLGLGLMIGCNVASTLGIAPEVHIASLFDHADLDGNLLVADDPWMGIQLVNGRQVPTGQPGLGISRRTG